MTPAPRVHPISEPGLSRAAVLAVAFALLGAFSCADQSDPGELAREADSARTADSMVLSGPGPAVVLLADSAAADSVAMASLPSRLRGDLDIRVLLSADALEDSSRAYCQPLSPDADAEVRKRLRGRWPDSLALVLFVRADRASGALNRVELVRRTADGGQRGYIWDRDAGETKAVEWPADFGRPDTYELPEGTPTPLALRGLGRRLLVLPCTGAPPG